MAYIGQVSIKCVSHVEHAIQYIEREEKAMKLPTMKEELSKTLIHLKENTNPDERATYINCTAHGTAIQFENMRKAFNQDKGVIAHHYYQSFDKADNITPEQSHKIGVELAKKMFPNFQVVIATHIDRDHIHNHIIVNSCNIVTGQKWYSNKRSLSDIRKESDRLCLENGLSVITKNSKYKGIDRTTYQLGIKGKSWKVNLVHDLDKAVECCKSKEQFLALLRERDYIVKYTEKNITVTKGGESKGIRVDTLARQFGEKYTKENLEKKMGYYSPPLSDTITEVMPPKKVIFHSDGISNWEHYERNLFKRKNYLPSTQYNIVRDVDAERYVKYAERSLLYSRNIFELVIKSLALLLMKSQRIKKYSCPVRYKKVQQLRVMPYITFGNIRYRELKETSGDTYTVRVSMDKLLYLVNQPILYSAKIDKDDSNSVVITVKKKDKAFLSNLIKLEAKLEQLDKQSEKIYNRNTYKELKEAAEQSGTKLNYLIITAEQKEILCKHYIKFACFDKEDKFNIAFMPDKAELIKKLIYPAEKKKVEETPQQKNNRVYANLKKKAALNGEKLRFKTKLTKEQVEALEKNGLNFAYFSNKENEGLYNIAYENSYEAKINDVLAALKKPKLS